MNYINKDINNPKYIFHGSPNLIEGIIEPRQAYCDFDKQTKYK